jgi:hypothetical protein
LVVGGVLALLALGPLLGRGYVLTYDMVFVPRLALTQGLLGLDTAVARAVPADLLVALASRVVPADLVQKLVLAGVFVGAAAGAARLTSARTPVPRAAAAVLYVWNPFVYERLVMGHWGLLVSYAALPWVARAALDLRAGTQGAVRRLVLAMAVAAAGNPAGGLIAAAVALCVGAVDVGAGVVRAVDVGARRLPGRVTLPIRGPRQRGPGFEPGQERGSGFGPVGERGSGIEPGPERGPRFAHGAEQGPGIAHGPERASGFGRARSGMAARVGIVVAIGLVVNVPWVVPSLLRPGGVPVRPEGVAAFSARPDGPLGTVGSLVGLGGIWNALAVPPGVGSWPWLAGFAVVLAVAVAGLPVLLGWRPVRAVGSPVLLSRWPVGAVGVRSPGASGGRSVSGGRWPPGAAAGLLLVAGIGLLLAAAPAIPGLRNLVELVVTEVPGGGLVRDGQKFVAPLALVEAVCFGLGVERVLPALPPRWTRPAAALLVAAPVLLLPALAWGGAGRLAAVRYPPAFGEARAVMALDRVPGAVLVLPWHLYRPFSWNRDRVVLDPAQRWFTRRAVGNDDLELVGMTVPGEDPYGARLGPLVRAATPLAPELPRAGIRYVLVYKEPGWSDWNGRLDGLDLVLDRAELALYRVPGRPIESPFPTPPAAPVVAADLLAVALLIWVVARPSLPLRPRRLVFSGRHRQGGPE